MKYLVMLAFIAILGSLGAALYFMMKAAATARPPAAWRARWRSVWDSRSCCFLCVLLAWKLGYIQPTGIARRKIAARRPASHKKSAARRFFHGWRPLHIQ
jgi:hypothetical protein